MNKYRNTCIANFTEFPSVSLEGLSFYIQNPLNVLCMRFVMALNTDRDTYCERVKMYYQSNIVSINIFSGGK